MTKLQHFFLILILGLIVSVPVILPYFNPGYFPTHDGEWAVVRAAEMFREIRDLQLPPRFSQALNFGYGYPLFNFAYPGPYYITTFIHGLGFSFITSVKILFALTVPLSFYGMYLLSTSVFKKKMAGFISAVLYIYLPYRMVDLYVRGNIGEAMSFVLFPFIFWTLFNVVTKKRKVPYILIGSPLIFVFILSHNIMSVYLGILFAVFLFACILSHKVREAFLSLFTVLWGALLSAYFILPALYEKKFIKLSEIPIADRNLYYTTFEKLLFSKWGYGTPTEANSFPYLIGIPQILGASLVLQFFKKKKSFEKTLLLCFSVLLVIFVFMMFPISSFIWQLPLLSEINYPWTLLLPISFLTCLLSGSVFLFKKGLWVGIFLVALSVILYFPFARPSEYIVRDDNYYITNEATTTSSQELMPLWVEVLPTERFLEKVVTTGDSYATNISYDSKKVSFVAEMKEPGKVTVNTIYYPGWSAYVNNSRAVITYDNPQGLMEIELPQGSQSVAFHFSETPVRLTADVISVLALLTYFGMLFTVVILQIQKPGKKKQ